MKQLLFYYINIIYCNILYYIYYKNAAVSLHSLSGMQITPFLRHSVIFSLFGSTIFLYIILQTGRFYD